MSLRDQRESERRFRDWVKLNRVRLLQSGIPLAAWSSLRNWQYFVEHQDLTYEQDPSGFSIDDLTPEQSNVLRELLESEYNNGLDRTMFITGWNNLSVLPRATESTPHATIAFRGILLKQGIDGNPWVSLPRRERR